MFKSQLEPSSENFVETQIFVENIFDTVKKAREAKAARSLAESKLAHYDYSFDLSPSKRKKTRKNAKSKTPKNGKAKTTPKKKPRKPRTPKDSAEKKKKIPTTPKTPRKYTKRVKVKPQNDIDDEEAAFILSSISQRSFDSFYNRFNGTTHVVNKIQIPLETSTVVQPMIQPQPPTTPKKCEPNHLTSYHHVLLDHNYWIVEPPTPVPPTPTSTVVMTDEPEEKSIDKSQTSMNLLLTVASHELSPQCTQNSTNSIKVEVNNNKLPLLDVNCDTPKLSIMSDDNAVKKRWLRQATHESSTPSPTVTPPETSPNDMKAPLKKRRIAREIDDNNEIKMGICSETESSKIDQTVCFESNNFKNNVEAIKFNNNFVNNSALLKCEPAESVNINLREIHEKMEMEFGRQLKNEQNVVVVKEEPRSVIQSPLGHHVHGVKNNLTFGIQMNSPVDVNAIYGRSQPENLIKIEQQRNMVGNEGKLPQTQIYDEKLIKLEPHERPHDYRINNVNIVEIKLNDKIPQAHGIKTEAYGNIQHVIKPEIYDQKQIKIESSIPEKVITVDGKLQQILDGKIQKIYRDNSQYIIDQHVDQKVQNYGQFYNKVADSPHQMSVIKNIEEISYRNQMENIQKQNHIIIHTGSLNDMKMPENVNDLNVCSIYGENHLDGFPKIHQLSPSKAQLSPTKLSQLKGLSSPTKIQISPTRTYEIYTKNPNENIAESLLKLQQESPVKLIQMSPTKVIQNSNYQVAQALTFEASTDHGYQKKSEESSAKKLKKTQKAAKIKTKTPKIKKTPVKAKKAQQKPKKVKTPKSPSKIGKNKKSSVKIDKNLIKNFGNLEDVPLKIRQNLAFEEKIMMKMKENDGRTQRVSVSDGKLSESEAKVAKIHPIEGLVPHMESKFQQIGGKIIQVDGKVGQNDIELNFNKSNIPIKYQNDSSSIIKPTQNDVELQRYHENDTKLLETLSKIHGSEEKISKTETKLHQNNDKFTKIDDIVKKNDERDGNINANQIKNENSNSNFYEVQAVSRVENSHNPQHFAQDEKNSKHFNNNLTKFSKRSISESSSGSSKTSTCSSRHSKSSNNSTEFIQNSTELLKSPPKKAFKKLKFDESECGKESQKSSISDECEVKLRNLMKDSKEILSHDQHAVSRARDFITSPISNQNSATFSNFQVIKDSFAEKGSKRTISESSSLSSRTLSCNSPENTPNLSSIHSDGFSPIKLVTTSYIPAPVSSISKAQDAKLASPSKESQQETKPLEIKEFITSSSPCAQLASSSPKNAQISSKSTIDKVVSVTLDTVDSSCNKKIKTISTHEEISCKEATNLTEATTKLNSELPKTVATSSGPTSSSDQPPVTSKVLTKTLNFNSQPLHSTTEDLKPDEHNDDVTSDKPDEILPQNSSNINQVNKSSSNIQHIHSSSPKLEDDIIKTIIQPPSILKSLSDGIAPIKPTIDSSIPFKTAIETLESIIDTTKSFSDSLSDSKPEKVVEQQVASILEKVIPKTLKIDFVREIEVEVSKIEPETEPIESDNDIDDEDDTPYRECVEEFHKDTLEKLIEANKRFCRESYVHNPFKHSVSYDGRDSGRHSKTDDYHSRGNRCYDYDDHRKPLKMSLSFDSHQQYSHHSYPPHYQRSISEVFNDPRKERWCGNGMYENRNYGSFHYDKIHHREPITTTYSMYRAQKASQMDSRWGSRQNYDYPQEQQHKVNNFVSEKPPMAPQPQSQPTTPTIINNYKPIQPEPIRSEPLLVAVSPQAEALKIAISDPFGGFLKDTKLNVISPVAVLPKTKTASHDPRLNPSLAQDIKKEESVTPKKKLSLDQYRKRKSLTNVTQISPTDEIGPSISVSITESPSPTLPPAFDPSIVAAAATG